MEFDPYVVLTGAKDHIITSRRKGVTPLSQPETDDRYEWPSIALRRHCLSNHFDRSNHLRKRTVVSKYADILTRLKKVDFETKWKAYTLIGASMAIIGFTVQFIGLRGLAYPCSVAHLVSILLMAGVRGIIRRRLGWPPDHTPASPGYELDFLAADILFRSDIYENPSPFMKKTRESDLRPSFISQWGVASISPEKRPKLFARESAWDGLSDTKRDSDSRSFETTSEELVRVRRRLGDLSRWESKATEISRSLVNSIEAFMDLFFPEELESLEWFLKTFDPEGREDYVRILIDRRSSRSWRVKLGDIESVLSMWMASAEAGIRKERGDHEATKTDKKTNETREEWRRTTAQLGSKYKFCRVLGDDTYERRLKRDISWWVDELIADEIDDSRSKEKMDEADIIIGFNGGQG